MTIVPTEIARFTQCGATHSRASRLNTGQREWSCSSSASKAKPRGPAALWSAIAICRFWFEQPVQMHDKVAYCRVVHRQLSPFLPGSIGCRVVRIDADNIERVKIAKAHLVERRQLAAEHQMQELVGRFPFSIHAGLSKEFFTLAVVRFPARPQPPSRGESAEVLYLPLPARRGAELPDCSGAPPRRAR